MRLALAIAILVASAGCDRTRQDLGGNRGSEGALGAVVAIAAGRAHSCALDESGEVWCWGDAHWGQLGVDARDVSGSCGGLACSDAPVHIDALDDVREIAAGGFVTCALENDGRVRCFGNNSLGQLARGQSDDEPHATPYTVGVEDVGAVALGAFHGCVFRWAGTVACWGLGDQGQLGVDPASLGSCVASEAVASYIGVAPGTAVPCAIEPIEVPGIDDAVGIAAGYSHTCVVRESGGVRCWGRGVEGQLGHGAAPASSATPVDVIGVTRASELAAGETMTCAKTRDATVACWGANEVGQLANGATPSERCGESWVPCSAAPIDVVVEDVLFEALALGSEHACGAGMAGELFCWGSGERGALGVGPVDGCDGPPGGGTACRATPARVEGAFVAVAAGDAHTCAVREDGAVACWGLNAQAQAGAPADEGSAVPRVVE